ncbi:hypothetical protein FRB96_004718 [Tulasnella sp. 330]|nr:hypothetical protein FRB96_004718 [Tulasnella sp. 330]
MAPNKSVTLLSGFYYYFFGLIEPISTLAGAAAGWTNTAKFFHDQIPSNSYIRALDPRSQTVVWQLSSCYFLLGMLSFVFFRSLRQAVKDAFIQEYMMKRYLACLAIADLIHVAVTLYGLPEDIRTDPMVWNAMTHGNINFTMFLFIVRIAWFTGIGRSTYGPRVSRTDKVHVQ